MGFFINEFTYELKQHLNLSERAWNVIYSDMRDFYGEESKQSFSGFLNRVFFHFYSDAHASISLQSKKMREQLLALAQKNSAAFPKDSRSEQIIDVLLAEHRSALLQKACSYPKGIGKKFRVNRQNIDVLCDCDDAELYADSIGTYMKAVFEEYTTLSAATRESIFFKETIDACQMALTRRNKLKISLQQRVSRQTNQSYTRKFYVTPYALVTDKNDIYNYLVGICEEIHADGTTGEKRISSFRISRIDKIAVMSSMSGFLSQQKMEEIRQELQKKSPQYMAGDIVDIEVSFTKQGLEQLERQLYLRPASYEKSGESSFIFHCTELQAIHYFFKFGKDAQIVRPQSLHDKIKHYYEEALSAYQQADAKASPEVDT